MCITLLSTKNRPTEETLRICFANNKDGAGLAWAHDGKLYLEKGFFSFNEFWAVYKQIPKENTALIAHFRKITTGPKDKKNCHPWHIDENHVFAHNGTFKQFEDKKADKLSDTGKFVNGILKPMFKICPVMWRNEWMKSLLDAYVGSKNKCIILSNTGEYSILNQQDGLWDNGVWYSNDSFRRRGVLGWADTIIEKKNYCSHNPTTTMGNSGTNILRPILDFTDATLTQIDSILKNINKKRFDKLTPITKDVTFKNAFNIKMTPYAEKLIKQRDFRVRNTPLRPKIPKMSVTDTRNLV